MIGMVLAMLMQAGPPPPTDPERLALGRRLAETGTLATLLPLMAEKEIGEIVGSQPGLSPAEQAALRREGEAQFQATRDRVMEAEARAFAGALDTADLRMLVASADSAPARRLRAAMPGVILATMQALAGVDFKKQVLTAFCAKTGKACGE